MPIDFQSVSKAAPGSPGNLDFDFDFTPQLIKIEVAERVSSINDFQAHASFCIGFSNGSINYAISNTAENARSADTETRRFRSNVACAVLNNLNANTTKLKATATFSANKATLNFSETTTAMVTVTAFAGISNISMSLLRIPQTVDTNVSVTGMGSQPNTCMLTGATQAVNDTGNTNAKIGFGAVAYNGTATKQACINYTDSYNDPTTLNGGRISNNRCFGIITNNIGNDYELEHTSWNSDGATFTTRGSGAASSSEDVICVLFTTPNDEADIIIPTLPTTIGEHNTTGFNFTGFYPKGVIGAISDSATVNSIVNGDSFPGPNITNFTDINSAGSFTLSEYGVATSSCWTGTYARPLTAYGDDITPRYWAEMINWVDGGFRLDHQVAGGKAVYAFFLGFKGEAVPTFPNDWTGKGLIKSVGTYIDSNQTNYPALIDEKQVAHISNFWSMVQNGGGDLRFTSDPAGASQLPHEVVECNTSTQKLQVWVKRNFTSSGGDTVYIWFKSSTTAVKLDSNSTYGRYNVWDSNFLGGFHLENNGYTRDFTSNNYFLSNNTGTTNGTGQIGEGRDFDGVDDVLTTGAGPYGPTVDGLDNLTVEGWFKFDTTGVEEYLIQQRDATTINGQYMLYKNSSNELVLSIYNFGFQWTTQEGLKSTGTLTSGQWYYLVGVRDGDDGYLYIDGSEDGSANGTALNFDDERDFAIGQNYRDANFEFDGVLDEIRVSDIARSADWIKLNYYSQLNTENLWAPVSLDDVNLRGNLKGNLKGGFQ